EFRQALAASYTNRAGLLRATGRRQEAEQDHSQALIIQKRLALDFPLRPEFSRDLSSNHQNRGNLLIEMGRVQEAEQDFEQALIIKRKLAADFPNQPDLQNELALTCGNLAFLNQQLGKWALAKRLLLESRPHHLTALNASPRNPSYR